MEHAKKGSSLNSPLALAERPVAQLILQKKDSLLNDDANEAIT